MYRLLHSKLFKNNDCKQVFSIQDLHLRLKYTSSLANTKNSLIARNLTNDLFRISLYKIHN